MNTIEAVEPVRPEPGHHAVEITVNERPVTVDDRRLTGLQIKEAAIAQGVPIAVDFVLSEELEHGRTKIIGDRDVVTVQEHSRFDAVAPDDNS
jgi:hypothetical protein